MKTVCLWAFLAGFLIDSAFAREGSAALDDFWKQWLKAGVHLQSEKAIGYIKAFGERSDPTLIKAMILDVRNHPDEAEVRDMTYGLVILYMPDRKGCKAAIAKAQAIGDREDQMIASDFQADIEEAESGREKMPLSK